MADLTELRSQLIAKFTESFDSVISKFLDRLSENVGKNKEELYALWAKELPKKRTTTRKPAASATSSTSTTTSSSTCAHVMQRGNNKGKNCPYRPKDGTNYCSKHTPKNAQETKVKVEANGDASSESEDEKVEIESKGHKYALVKDGNNLVHRNTGFVFNGNKKVTGKIVQGSVVPLTDADVERCKNEFGFSVEAASTTTSTTTSSKSKPSSSKKDESDDSSSSESDTE